jgi:hypothetical protein
MFGHSEDEKPPEGISFGGLHCFIPMLHEEWLIPIVPFALR